ncbi:unnamed protein product [Moneuplotes crassus]|uniref:Uncharacterized protein n=1 Tax=Euplotes crassus TaxID=5936 RepID=A0AAD1UGM3_EUPCR|nr:unnamed protein product [Moneuplotes crassus]
MKIGSCLEVDGITKRHTINHDYIPSPKSLSLIKHNRQPQEQSYSHYCKSRYPSEEQAWPDISEIFFCSSLRFFKCVEEGYIQKRPQKQPAMRIMQPRMISQQSIRLLPGGNLMVLSVLDRRKKMSVVVVRYQLTNK